MRLIKTWAALFIVTGFAAAAVGGPPPSKTRHGNAESPGRKEEVRIEPVTHTDIDAVLLAIKDEIYAGGCAPVFADIGRSVAHKAHVHQINAYFQPSFHDGHSWVIYKFWPFGQVSRMYWIDKSGLAHLYGNPTWGFPPTEPSMLTIYLGDRELCRMESKWKRVRLDINMAPSAERIREAERRQKKRDGFLHVCRGKWHANIFTPEN